MRRLAALALGSALPVLALVGITCGGAGGTAGNDLTVSPTVLAFGSSASSLTISIACASAIAWTASADRTWLALSPTSGTGDGSVTVTLDRAALASGPNSATVTIAWDGGSRRVAVSATGGGGSTGLLPTGAPYDMGAPGTMVDLYVSPSGSDDPANPGTSRASPLRSLHEAWDRVTDLGSTGYRINLLPGSYPYDDSAGDGFNDYADRVGSAAHPIVLQPADGPGTVTIEHGLNFRNDSYVYVLDLAIIAPRALGTSQNNVIHLDGSDHVLLRGCTIRGADPNEFQEAVKANQCQSIYLEDSDISGCYQTGVDWFSVQYGQVLHCGIHDVGDWAAYFKGGSAYIRADGNDCWDCGQGIQAGEGSNLEVMRTPWLHYEAYDIKVVNNVLREIPGTGLSACGAYNALFAYNTLYRVATSADPGHALFQFVHGSRSCVDMSENGVGNATEICSDLIAHGAWGTSVEGDGGEWIPNRNVYVLNNVFYNPAGVQTQWTHFDLQGATSLPGTAQGIPDPSLTDTGAILQGNIVWNGPADHPLGLDASTVLTETQVRAVNSINAFEPQLTNPGAGDLTPVAGGNVDTATPATVPDFGWSDAPTAPAVPQGNLSNAVPTNHDGAPRSAPGRPGAY